MKQVLQFTILATLAILICLPSCTKPEEKISGKWKITYAKIDGDKVDNAIGETWNFKDHGEFYGYLGIDDYRDDYTNCDWEIDGNELILSGGDLEKTYWEHDEYGSYSVSYKIVLNLDIEQLDKKNLIVTGKMKIEESETEDGETEYDTDSYKVDFELEAK